MISIMYTIFIIFIIYVSIVSTQNLCGNWVSFNDEKCIKIVNEEKLMTYEEAVHLCSLTESASTPITIHSKEEQDFIVKYVFETLNIVENVWLGLTNSSKEFEWIDRRSVDFTNWANGSPLKSTDHNCVEMIADSVPVGKWFDIQCNKRNIAICQRIPELTVSYLQNKLSEAKELLKKCEANTMFTTVRPTSVPPINVTNPSICPIGEFACKSSSQCILKSKVCDFKPDCPDGSDEASCGTCNFDDNSMCGWTNIGQGKQQWITLHASKIPLNSGLPRSGAISKSTGNFLIIDTSKGGTLNLPAVITTPVLGATGPNCKMTLYYTAIGDANSEGVFKVILYRASNGTFSKQLFQIESKVQAWTLFTVSIGSLPAGYQVQISGFGNVKTNTAPYVDMEVDEIKFVDCSPTSA